MPRLAPLLALLSLAALPRPALADPAPPWAISLKGGLHVYLNAQSFVAQHRIQQSLRLDATFRFHPRLELGAEVQLTATANADYRLVGGSLLARFLVVEGELGAAYFLAGAGVGAGARILSKDLARGSPVVPYGQLGIGGRFALVKDRLFLGLEAIDEQITVLTASLVVTVRL